MVTRSCDGETQAMHQPKKSTVRSLILLWFIQNSTKYVNLEGVMTGSVITHHPSDDGKLYWLGRQVPSAPPSSHALMLPVLGGNISADGVSESTDSGAVQTLCALLVGFVRVQSLLFMHWAHPARTTSRSSICPDSQIQIQLEEELQVS